MSAYDILSKFFDEGSFNETDALLKSKDGAAEAVTGFGTVDGVTVYAFCQDVDNQGGAMSKAQAKKILKVYDLALKTGSPIVGFYDSIGGRIDDKDILTSYGEILNKASTLSGVVPQISVVLGNCLGTSALTAASADFVIMSKDAKLSINVNDDASAEFNASHGIATLVEDDTDKAIKKAQKLLSYLPENNLEMAPIYSEGELSESKCCLPMKLCDAETELCLGKCFIHEEAGTAFARIAGMTVGFVNAKMDKISCKASCKIEKFVKFCDAFSIPVITFVNSERFECLKSASKVTSAYAEATTAKISVITGKAIGAAYIALCGAGANVDMVYALDNAIVSPVNELAAAFILDAENMNVAPSEMEDKAKAFVKANLSATVAAENGYIDDVCSESDLRSKLITSLNALVSKRVSTLPKKHSTI